MLGTDPTSVLTRLARVDEDGGLTGAVTGTYHAGDLVDLTTLAMMFDLRDAFTSWRLDDDDAEQVILALHQSPVHGRPFYRWGHSSVAAARILLDFDGDCHGCGEHIYLDGTDARDNVHVHTADPRPRPDPDPPFRTDGPCEREPYRAEIRRSAYDWPAVICTRCRDRMRNGNFHSFVDFRFAQNPECPSCGGRRTKTIQYGMPSAPEAWGPWLQIGGCCPKGEKWCCDVCDHRW